MKNKIERTKLKSITKLEKNKKMLISYYLLKKEKKNAKNNKHCRFDKFT